MLLIKISTLQFTSFFKNVFYIVYSNNSWKLFFVFLIYIIFFVFFIFFHNNGSSAKAYSGHSANIV